VNVKQTGMVVPDTTLDHRWANCGCGWGRVV